MSNALLRHWQMLTLVPRAPKKIDTANLQDRLESRGFNVNRRSIQRDLVKLSSHFALVCDERGKPFGWSWARDAQPFDIPGMDMHTALAFNLAAEHLAHLLPHATFNDLRPHFERARAVLDTLDDNELARWRSCIRVLPNGLPMAPPTVQTEVLEAIHDGLLHRRQLEISYQPRTKTSPRAYVANPLALVYRDKIAYLVCALYEYDNVVQFAVHRVSEVKQTGLSTRVPPDFDLDAYIGAGEFGFRVGEAPIQLVARLRDTVVIGLAETPLSADQTLRPAENGWAELRATVADTAQLRVWLRGHGSLCQVLGPPALRAQIADEMAVTARLYVNGAGAAGAGGQARMSEGAT